MSLISNLTTPQRVEVISDAEMAATVGATAASATNNVPPKPNLTAVPSLAGTTSVRPGRLLMQLGKALTPKLPQSDFDRSRRWAFYRYFWAFESPTPGMPLRLSSPAYQLTHHHRTLLSEQLGIALALELAHRHLASHNPGGTVFWADGDVVLDAGALVGGGSALAVHGATLHKMRPDYFFASVEPQGTANVWAVECKGSHSPALWASQLRTAASQVANVLVDATPPPALLFATYLDRSKITVRVLDPPSDKWRGPYAKEQRSDSPYALEPRAERAPSWIVERPEQFRADLALVNASGALAFAGAYGAAAEALPEYMKRSREFPPLGDEPRDEVRGFDTSFVGTTSTLPVRSDLTVEVFTGVERAFYDAAIRKDIDYLMGHRTQPETHEGLLAKDCSNLTTRRICAPSIQTGPSSRYASSSGNRAQLEAGSPGLSEITTPRVARRLRSHVGGATKL